MPKKKVKKTATKKVTTKPASKAAAFRARANALRIGSSTGQPTQEQHENLIIAKTLDEVADLL